MSATWATSGRERASFAPVAARQRWLSWFARLGNRSNDGSPVGAAPPSSFDPRIYGLLGQISHDLRTPLNAIVGFSDIMERELLGPIGAKPYQSYAGHIRQSGLALVQTVDDLLDLMRILAERTGRDRGPLDLPSLLDDAIELQSARAAARPIQVDVIAKSKRRVAGDRSVLVHAVGNLLHCAACRAPAHATVTVTTGVRAQTSDAVAMTVEYPAGPAAASDPSALSLTIARSLVALQGGTIADTTSRNGSERLLLALPAA